MDESYEDNMGFLDEMGGGNDFQRTRPWFQDRMRIGRCGGLPAIRALILDKLVKSPQLRHACEGRHPDYLKTLDSRSPPARGHASRE